MYLILLSILTPVLSGIYLLVRKEHTDRKYLLISTGTFLILTGALATAALITAYGTSFTLFHLTEALPIVFTIDGISVLFSSVTLIVFLCAGFFSFEYMKHENLQTNDLNVESMSADADDGYNLETNAFNIDLISLESGNANTKEKRYYGFYLIVFGILNALCFAGNLITFYLFFEMLTLSAMPLVLHNGSHEAIMAGLKYLFYSLCGAYMALYGIYFINKYSDTLTFTAGGVLNEAARSHADILLIVALVVILGFGVKAGMFPMHAWLPAAHPVAPAPASAVLSAVIVKAGVLAIVRVIYYIFGSDFLQGTWVQNTWLVLTLTTVFMGSMLAYREPVLKKRLAYSTVSQLSYILFGLAAMGTESVTGAFLHVLAHAMIKAVLFLCAGAIIYMTGKTRVDELRGIGKEMPVTMWCYTIASLGLIGIPPTGGFISKWYLAIGSLSSSIPIFNWLGPVILLISALLTAGYLLPLTIHGFLPGADYDYGSLVHRESSLFMTIPIIIMTAVSLLIGLFPTQLVNWLMDFIN